MKHDIDVPISWQTGLPKDPKDYNDLDKLLVSNGQVKSLLRELMTRIEVLEQELSEFRQVKK